MIVSTFDTEMHFCSGVVFVRDILFSPHTYSFTLRCARYAISINIFSLSLLIMNEWRDETAHKKIYKIMRFSRDSKTKSMCERWNERPRQWNHFWKRFIYFFDCLLFFPYIYFNSIHIIIIDTSFSLSMRCRELWVYFSLWLLLELQFYVK